MYYILFQELDAGGRWELFASRDELVIGLMRYMQKNDTRRVYLTANVKGLIKRYLPGWAVSPIYGKAKKFIYNSLGTKGERLDMKALLKHLEVIQT